MFNAKWIQEILPYKIIIEYILRYKLIKISLLTCVSEHDDIYCPKLFISLRKYAINNLSLDNILYSF